MGMIWVMNYPDWLPDTPALITILLSLVGTLAIVWWFHRRQRTETIRFSTRFAFKAARAELDPDLDPDYSMLSFGGEISNSGAYTFVVDRIGVEVFRGGDSIAAMEGELVDTETKHTTECRVDPRTTVFVGTLVSQAKLPYADDLLPGEGAELLVNVRARLSTLAGESIWTEWDEAEHFIKLGPGLQKPDAC